MYLCVYVSIFCLYNYLIIYLCVYVSTGYEDITDKDFLDSPINSTSNSNIDEKDINIDNKDDKDINIDKDNNDKVIKPFQKLQFLIRDWQNFSLGISIYQSIYLSINLSLYQSINISIYPSINLSIYLSISLIINLSISLYQSIYRMG
jgi:hypothetical protein